MNTKKILAALFVVVLLLLFVAPGIVGIIAERQFRNMSASVANEAPGLQLLIEDYQRGWFSSRARYRLTLNHPALLAAQEGQEEEAGSAKLPTLLNEAEIFHGPIALTAFGRDNVSMWPMLAHSIDKPIFTSGSGERVALPGNFSTRLSLGGEFRNHAVVQPLEHHFDDEENPATLNWRGMNLTTNFSAGFGKLSMNGEVSGATIDGDRFSFSSEGLTIQSEQTRTQYGIWTGRSFFDWPGMQGNAEGQAPFSMGKMTIDARNELLDKKFDQALNMSVAHLKFGDWNGGPGTLNMAFESLDAAALGELTRELRAFAQTTTEGQETSGMAGMFPHIQALLAAGPHLALQELSFGTPEGVIMLTAELVFPESSPEAAFGFILGLEGAAHLQIPVALLEKLGEKDPAVAAQLQDLMNAGFLVRSENNLVLKAAIKNGLLTVNGQPIPLPLSF